VNDAINSSPLDVRDHRLERRQVAVNIRDDSQSHYAASRTSAASSSTATPRITPISFGGSGPEARP
jgi:hypothetical protein